MSNKPFIRILKVFAILLALPGLSWAGNGQPAWQQKIDPVFHQTLQQLPAGESIEFFVFLSEQADLGPARAINRRVQRGTWVNQTLVEVANRTQAPLLRLLQNRGIEHRSYWVANMIWVHGDASDVRLLARRPEVARILGNPEIKMPAPVLQPTPVLPGGSGSTTTTFGAAATSSIEPNIAQINAPDVWALGVEGEGVVVASADTGVHWTHPAIKSQYRGWNGVSANHNYNWHDAIHSGGGVCGADTTAPRDDDSHGTHTVGTMVGDDGGSNQIGVAPKAQWIGCRNMDETTGTPATYSDCFQWFIAPTDLNGLSPDPSKAPHIINNSWSCPAWEGCGDPLILQTVVENTRAAGIAVVASAGNGGPACNTVNTPPAIYDASFSVAAVNASDAVASFSSRGPVTIDGSNRFKPDISAPGVSIRSAVPGGIYSNKSGTSMAGPHVAGLMALLIASNGDMEWTPDLLEYYVTGYALPLTTTEGCGGDSTTAVPNHTYGYGRIDALASVQAAGIGFNVPALPPGWLVVAMGALLVIGLVASRRIASVR